MGLKILDEDEELNPMLSVINLIDVLLVLIATLLIIIVQNPLNPYSQDDVTVIKKAMFALIVENVRNVPQSRAEQRNRDLFAPSL